MAAEWEYAALGPTPPRLLDGRGTAFGVWTAAEGFDRADVSFSLVDKQTRAAGKTNAHSAWVRAGARVELRPHPSHGEIWHGGRRISRHERCHGRRQQELDLDVLGHEPPAPGGSECRAIPPR